MPINAVRRKPGRPGKPKTASEAQLEAHESQIRSKRRRISGKDRRFVAEFALGGFSDAEAAAKAAGFVEPGIGWKLTERLRDLIDAERVRASIGTQMELDEALRLCAERARTAADEKVGLGYMTLILKYHGAISDNKLPTDDRRKLVRQVHEIVDQLKTKLSALPDATARARVKRMLTAPLDPGNGSGSNEASDETEIPTPTSTSASSAVLDVEARSTER